MHRKISLRTFSTSIFFTILLAFVGQFQLFAQDFPPVPNALVTDYTNTLSSGQKAELEQKLLRFEDSTSIQIAVVVMTSTGDYDVADYGDRLAAKWGIGNKKFNNGILFLVALGDRAMTIRTGYGLEGAVPDAIAYRIIENEVKPAFRQGDYFTGINRGTDAIISYSKGEYKADPNESYSTEGGGGIPIIFIIIVIIVIISVISKSGGGGKNGGGRVMGGRGSSDLFWWTLLNSLGGGGRDNDGGGFGGGFGGGGGGGFGGFGGGGFGGGGASGRW
ncbi:TPM domain-containing protein [Sphingobacterium lactis]|uniref:TPM domain-containing protein n=1 Tax=Sphingobacterium lactis TaxID=797291 RepID=UPI003DA507CF